MPGPARAICCAWRSLVRLLWPPGAQPPIDCTHTVYGHGSAQNFLALLGRARTHVMNNGVGTQGLTHGNVPGAAGVPLTHQIVVMAPYTMNNVVFRQQAELMASVMGAHIKVCNFPGQFVACRNALVGAGWIYYRHRWCWDMWNGCWRTFHMFYAPGWAGNVAEPEEGVAAEEFLFQEDEHMEDVGDNMNERASNPAAGGSSTPGGGSQSPLQGSVSMDTHSVSVSDGGEIARGEIDCTTDTEICRSTSHKDESSQPSAGATKRKRDTGSDVYPKITYSAGLDVGKDVKVPVQVWKVNVLKELEALAITHRGDSNLLEILSKHRERRAAENFGPDLPANFTWNYTKKALKDVPTNVPLLAMFLMCPNKGDCCADRSEAGPHVTTAAVTEGIEAALRYILGYGADCNRIVFINVISLCCQIVSKCGASAQCVDVFQMRGWEKQREVHEAALELMLCPLKLTGFQLYHGICSSNPAQIAVTGHVEKGEGLPVLPHLKAQLPYLAKNSPETTPCIHAQYIAGTGGKKASDKKLATQCLGTATQISRGLANFVEAVDGRVLKLEYIFSVLARCCSKFSFLTPEMAKGVENLTSFEIHKLAVELKSQSGTTGGLTAAWTGGGRLSSAEDVALLERQLPDGLFLEKIPGSCTDMVVKVKQDAAATYDVCNALKSAMKESGSKFVGVQASNRGNKSWIGMTKGKVVSEYTPKLDEAADAVHHAIESGDNDAIEAALHHSSAIVEELHAVETARERQGNGGKRQGAHFPNAAREAAAERSVAKYCKKLGLARGGNLWFRENLWMLSLTPKMSKSGSPIAILERYGEDGMLIETLDSITFHALSLELAATSGLV